MTSAAFFTLRSLLVGEISTLGFEGLLYMAPGPIPSGIIYFTYRREWARRNMPASEDDPKVKKVLSRTWNNEIDYWSFFVCCFSAAGAGLCYIGVIISLKFSRLAGLNIGIASTIWSFLPFFVAFLELLIYGTRIKPFQFMGMLFLVITAVLIALSDLFAESAKEVTLEITEK